MAFLDNSGDIILDAVLTDVGRQKLANGNGISIIKFALGDDEINYGQFDKNHPSGSAYYDLEILQTPIFEAVTQINANVNYGLMSYTNPNLLYMPILKKNEIDNAVNMAATLRRGMYYVAANNETAVAMAGATAGIASNMIIESNSVSFRCIGYEFGIDSIEINKTSIDKAQYLTTTSLDGANFTVEANQLFINQVHSLGSTATAYANDLATNALATFPTITQISATTSTSLSRNRANYISYTNLKGASVNIYDPTGGGTTAGTHSVIEGPSSRLVLLNITVAPGLEHIAGGTRDRKYSEYGSTGQTATATFGDSVTGVAGTYDFIDTSIYLSHDVTGAQVSIPIRIVRKHS